MASDLVVVKSGGHHALKAERTKKLVKIILEDRRRRVIIPSGPKGMTDDLIAAAQERILRGNVARETYKKIIDKWEELCHGYGLPESYSSIKKLFDKTLNSYRGQSINLDTLKARRFIDKVAPLGEISQADYILVPLLNRAGLNAISLSPMGLIYGSDEPGNSSILPDPNKKLKRKIDELLKEYSVIVLHGYYCSVQNGKRGEIVTLPRGGTDTSGGHAAGELGALVYENRSDNPIMRANPKVVHNPLKLDEITYKEALELTFMGFGILTDEAIRPCMNKLIPIRVIDDFNGGGLTKILRIREPDGYEVAGVAHKPGYVDMTISTASRDINSYMLQEALGIHKRRDIQIRTGNSSVSFLVPGGVFTDEFVNEKTRYLMENFGLRDADIEVRAPISLISVAGEFMRNRRGINRRASTALDAAGLSTEDIGQAGREFSILYGVEEISNKGSEREVNGKLGVRSIYNEFFVNYAFERIPRSQLIRAKLQYLNTK